VTVLEEVPARVDFLFQADPVMDPDGWRRVEGDSAAPGILAGAIAAYETCEWTTEAVKDVTVALWSTFDVSAKRAQAPIRMAVTGRTVGPPLFEPLALLGRDEVLRRLRAAAERLGTP
jgi:glutamyl-tRNA synthetase